MSESWTSVALSFAAGMFMVAARGVCRRIWTIARYAIGLRVVGRRVVIDVGSARRPCSDIRFRGRRFRGRARRNRVEDDVFYRGGALTAEFLLGAPLCLNMTIGICEALFDSVLLRVRCSRHPFAGVAVTAQRRVKCLPFTIGCFRCRSPCPRQGDPPAQVFQIGPPPAILFLAGELPSVDDEQVCNLLITNPAGDAYVGERQVVSAA